MPMITTDGLGYLTGDEPGIGGVLKEQPSDFVVTELEQFTPKGHGDHLWLYVEKERRLTTDVVRFFARHFRVKWDDIGYAGLKDKWAVTRQWFSIEHADEKRAADFADDHVRILAVEHHTHKIKRGNLRGNRFAIRVRQVDASAAPRAKRVLDRLVRMGAPNFVGPQRFGYRKDNHLLGRYLLLGEYKQFCDRLLGQPIPSERELLVEARTAYERGEYLEALKLFPTVHRFERQALGPLSRGAGFEEAIRAIDKPHRELLMSAFQSAIFNRVVDNRLKAGLLGSVVAGDLAFKHATRGVFEVADVAIDQQRCDQLEISPTGPMWGSQMQKPTGESAEWERAAFAEADIAEDALFASRFCPVGTRRAMRIGIADGEVSGGADERGPYVEARFFLPRGCFATTVMREIMKDDIADDGEE